MAKCDATILLEYVWRIPISELRSLHWPCEEIHATAPLRPQAIGCLILLRYTDTQTCARPHRFPHTCKQARAHTHTGTPARAPMPALVHTHTHTHTRTRAHTHARTCTHTHTDAHTRGRGITIGSLSQSGRFDWSCLDLKATDKDQPYQIEPGDTLARKKPREDFEGGKCERKKNRD